MIIILDILDIIFLYDLNPYDLCSFCAQVMLGLTCESIMPPFQAEVVRPRVCRAFATLTAPLLSNNYCPLIFHHTDENIMDMTRFYIKTI